MKKFLPVILSLILVLSACGKKIPTETEPELSLHLLDNCISSTDNPNLFVIPNDTVNDMVCPQIYYLGDNLLFFDTFFEMGVEAPLSDGPSEGEEPYDTVYDTCTVKLRLISIEDGSLLYERDFLSMYNPIVQTDSDRVALNDIHTGNVYILDEKLETVNEYHIEGFENATAYLDTDFDTIYIFDYQNGVYSQDLNTNVRETLAAGYSVSPCGESNDNLYFDCVDIETQRNRYSYIDLDTNTVHPLPTDMPTDYCDVYGSMLLARDKTDYFHCELILDDVIYEISSADLTAALTDNGQLITRNDTCTEISLYEPDGSYISSFSFDEEYAHSIFPEYVVWNELYDGYFFIDSDEGDTVLMFWDPDIAVSGSDLDLNIKTEKQLPEGELLSPELYRRAAEMGEKYDVDIRIGELCELDYDSKYKYAEILTDNDMAENALDILEASLEMYPEGFFTQLKYEDISEIRIELTAFLRDMIGGFAENKGDYYLVAIDCNHISPYVVSHELSHVIDKRLEFDAQLRSDALYSEEKWLSLQPEGFDYAYSYDNDPDKIYEYYDLPDFSVIYFTDAYSLTFPTEDRATLFGTVMDEDLREWLGTHRSKNIDNKLDYYCRCIRDCFNTEGWPETTEWEKML